MDFFSALVATVELATIVVTFIMMGSGIPVCLQMYKQRSTANVPYALFLLLVFTSTLSLQYGIMISNKVLILINVVSVAVWGAYISIYILVSSPKAKSLWSLLGIVGLYTAHLYYLLSLPSDDHIPALGKYLQFWGMVICIAPAVEIYTMVKEKSAKCCNLSMLCGGTLNAAVWCLYGILINDVSILLPCVPGLLVNAIKFSLMFQYGLKSKNSVTATAIDGASSNGTFNKVYSGRKILQSRELKN